jgi:hypothetical protein
MVARLKVESRRCGRTLANWDHRNWLGALGDCTTNALTRQNPKGRYSAVGANSFRSCSSSEYRRTTMVEDKIWFNACDAIARYYTMSQCQVLRMQHIQHSFIEVKLRPSSPQSLLFITHRSSRYL